MTTKISEFADNLFGFITLLAESKYFISVLRYVSSNDIVYFSPHALFSQARSHIYIYITTENVGSKKVGNLAIKD